MQVRSVLRKKNLVTIALLISVFLTSCGTNAVPASSSSPDASNATGGFDSSLPSIKSDNLLYGIYTLHHQNGR